MCRPGSAVAEHPRTAFWETLTCCVRSQSTLLPHFSRRYSLLLFSAPLQVCWAGGEGSQCPCVPITAPLPMQPGTPLLELLPHSQGAASAGVSLGAQQCPGPSNAHSLLSAAPSPPPSISPFISSGNTHETSVFSISSELCSFMMAPCRSPESAPRAYAIKREDKKLGKLTSAAWL